MFGMIMIILIKIEYILYIFVVEFLYDIIIWFKLSKSFVKFQKDLFIVFIYLFFSNFVFFKENDVDLFFELEKYLCKYMDFGYVFLFGDFNSRIKNKFDYIENDVVYDFVFVLLYLNDDQLIEWINLDVGYNEYGIWLLFLCKVIGVCIVNG